MNNRTCSIDGCDKGGKLKRGWCDKHYKRWQVHGDAERVSASQCKYPRCTNPPRSDASAYCSTQCRKRMARDREVEDTGTRNRGKGHTAPCTTCGGVFTLHSQRLPAERNYCSRGCYWQGMTLPDAERDKRRRIGRAARRALERSARQAGEKFDPNEIYERDRWTCGICGMPVDQSVKYPHRESVNLDHIIPLSRGGTHTRDNVQCSHSHCNINKRDKMPDEMAMHSYA